MNTMIQRLNTTGFLQNVSRQQAFRHSVLSVYAYIRYFQKEIVVSPEFFTWTPNLILVLVFVSQKHASSFALHQFLVYFLILPLSTLFLDLLLKPGGIASSDGNKDNGKAFGKIELPLFSHFRCLPFYSISSNPRSHYLSLLTSRVCCKPRGALTQPIMCIASLEYYEHACLQSLLSFIALNQLCTYFLLSLFHIALKVSHIRGSITLPKYSQLF